VISGAESSEQNDDKANNLDDVILRQNGVHLILERISSADIVMKNSMTMRALQSLRV